MKKSDLSEWLVTPRKYLVAICCVSSQITRSTGHKLQGMQRHHLRGRGDLTVLIGRSICHHRHFFHNSPQASSFFYLKCSWECRWWGVKWWITLFINSWPLPRARLAPCLPGPQRHLWVWAVGMPVVCGLFCFLCILNLQQSLRPEWLLFIYSGCQTTDWDSGVNASTVAY